MPRKPRNNPPPDDEFAGVLSFADVPPYMPPEYPKVSKRGRKLFLDIKPRDGAGYRIPEDPIKVLGLLHHLSGKTWADTGEFFQLAISRIAAARLANPSLLGTRPRDMLLP
jgi:hypothetical protein